MAFRAVYHVNLGRSPQVQPGDVIPAVYEDSLGNEQKTDYKRLVDLGAAVEVKQPRSMKNPPPPVDPPAGPESPASGDSAPSPAIPPAPPTP